MEFDAEIAVKYIDTANTDLHPHGPVVDSDGPLRIQWQRCRRTMYWYITWQTCWKKRALREDIVYYDVNPDFACLAADSMEFTS